MRRLLFAVLTIIFATFASSATAECIKTLLEEQQPQPEQKDQSKPQLQGKSSPEARQGRVLAFLVEEVRHQLVLLPYYNVFDWLEGEVTAEGKVILRGQVVRPTTKSDAESRVRGIEGVEQVVNEIEVLPLSPSDERLRLELYRVLFNGDSPLFRYAIQAVPPIHIIVKNGRVTLKGVAATEMDSQIANLKARGVSGVFEVNNELRVEKQIDQK